ncbi:hypothetical protein BX666DRAFT_141984 [Dichotomocladium elegans]|nr:hypothetical protein BX666DRAFT_141984 [Dichotomocladium elegans]
MLCQVCETLGSITMNDSIRVYLLQITEGLKDKRRRGDFIQLAESQGKARLANWRKASGNKRRAVLRPLFTQKEKDALLIPHLDLLDDQRETICQTLNLNDRHQKVEQSHAKRLEAIYCAKQPVK